MAAPHVSGAAALMLAVDGNLTVAELKAGLLDTVDPLPTLLGLTVTGGRLNLNQAVRSVAARRTSGSTSPVPRHRYVAAGGTASYAVAITGAGGFGLVSLSVAGLPGGTSGPVQARRGRHPRHLDARGGRLPPRHPPAPTC